MDKKTRIAFEQEMQQFLREYGPAYVCKQDIESQIERLARRPFDSLSSFSIQELQMDLLKFEDEWGASGRRMLELGEKYWPEEPAEQSRYNDEEMEAMFHEYLKTHGEYYNRLLQAQEGLPSLRADSYLSSGDGFKRASECIIQADAPEGGAEDKSSDFEQSLKDMRRQQQFPKPRLPG